MRLALVSTPGAMPDLRLAPGSLDGDVIRSRLSLPDAGFRVVDLDPSVDLAEQLDEFFDRAGAPADAPILFYASSPVTLSVEGELFLCLDPAHPETGDSLHDVASLFGERAAGPVAFMLECRHAPDPDDPFRSAAVVGAAKQAIASASPGIELLVAARPLADDDSEDRPSPLTRALIEALDDPEAEHGLTMRAFFDAAREAPEVVFSVPCLAHARGRVPFELVVAHPGAARPQGEAPEMPPAREPFVTEPTLEPAFEEPPAEPAAPVAEEALEPAGEPVSEEAPESVEPIAEEAPEPAAPPPGPRPPYRSQELSIPVSIEDAPERPEPRAPYRSQEISIPIDFADSTDYLDESERSAEPPAGPPPPSTARFAMIPAAPPQARPEPEVLPRVIVNERRATTPPPPLDPKKTVDESSSSAPAQAQRASAEPPAARPSAPPPPPERTSGPPAEGSPSTESSRPPKAQRPAAASSDHVKLGDALRGAGDVEGALAAYKRALGMLDASAGGERAEIYVRLGQAKQQQDKRREAISHFEKALSLKPTHRAAMEALVELNVGEGDWRAVQNAEERLLAMLDTAEERFVLLMEFGARWRDAAGDVARARVVFERAREIRPDDLGVLGRLRGVYEAAGSVPDVLATRQRIAELTNEPRARAEAWFDLGKYCIFDLRRDELGLEHLDRALESDPTMLDPLALVARVLADRQEWSQLEQAYRRMLERVERIPKGAIRTEVTWELCRRLGVLFREHLEDPSLALDAFEDAVHEKPADLGTRLTAADLARSIGKHDRAAVHLEVAAALDPGRVATFHELFEVFQKLRRPDQAYEAACVSMFLRQADARERFIFEEHKPDGVPKPSYVLPAAGWGWLRVHDRDTFAEAVLAAAAPAAITLRLAQLKAEGRLPPLTPAARQDPEKTTISIVRSFAWAAHLLGVPAPAVYLDERDLALASVPAEEPSVVIGNKVLRGRSLAELAFFVGRHLAYHVGAHRMLLYYPSIEDLSACFLAAVKAAVPDAPVPAAIRAPVTELARGIALRLSEDQRAELAKAVAAFAENGSRANLGEWVAAVERCASRAGYLLAGDLDAAAAVLKSEPRTVLDADAKIADLLAFAVSEDHHELRNALGVAIQP